jgi:general L-amino acid transport system substrate-binding protein
MIKLTRVILAILSVYLIFSFTTMPIEAQVLTPTPAPTGPTLKTLHERNILTCGVNQDLVGLGYLDPNSGDVVGLEVDLCRALAVALFGDPAAVQFPPYADADTAMKALQSGEADLLIWDSPWTLTADTSGLEFGPPIFYTGEGIAVKAESGAKTWSDLNSKAVCVVKGSTAESEILPYAVGQGSNLQLISSDTLQAAWQNLQTGRCDALSAERVQLLSQQQRATDPQSYTVWDGANDVYTHEPYAPMMRNDDEQWSNIVRWTMLGLVEAEQLGITSVTVQSLVRQTDAKTNKLETDDVYLARVGPERARFLDSTLGIGAQLGLQPDFMRQAIVAVGNYGEIYERHFGTQGDLPLKRGMNSLSSDGGLIYAPDWR